MSTSGNNEFDLDQIQETDENDLELILKKISNLLVTGEPIDSPSTQEADVSFAQATDVPHQYDSRSLLQAAAEELSHIKTQHQEDVASSLQTPSYQPVAPVSNLDKQRTSVRADVKKGRDNGKSVSKQEETKQLLIAQRALMDALDRRDAQSQTIHRNSGRRESEMAKPRQANVPRTDQRQLEQHKGASKGILPTLRIRKAEPSQANQRIEPVKSQANVTMAVRETAASFAKKLERSAIPNQQSDFDKLAKKVEGLTQKVTVLTDAPVSTVVISELQAELTTSRKLAIESSKRLEALETNIHAITQKQETEDEQITKVAQDATAALLEKYDLSAYEQRLSNIETMLNLMKQQSESSVSTTGEQFGQLKLILSEMAGILKNNEERSTQAMAFFQAHRDTQQAAGTPEEVLPTNHESKPPVKMADLPAEQGDQQTLDELFPTPEHNQRAGDEAQVVKNPNRQVEVKARPSSIRSEWQERRNQGRRATDQEAQKSARFGISRLFRRKNAAMSLCIAGALIGATLYGANRATDGGVMVAMKEKAKTILSAPSQDRVPNVPATDQSRLADNPMAPVFTPQETSRSLASAPAQQNTDSVHISLGADQSTAASIATQMETDSEISTASVLPVLEDKAKLAAVRKDVVRKDVESVGSIRRLSPPSLPATIGSYKLRTDALNGDGRAQYEIAGRYEKGLGVQKDIKQALHWYKRAAKAEYAPAQYRLATFYERGQGVLKDYILARNWYERAAKNGNRKAMHNLAVLVSSQNGGSQDYQKAAHWFKQAANAGLADSQYNLGVLYHDGLGVEKDLTRAYFWFSLAAKQGDHDGRNSRQRTGQLIQISERFEIDRMVNDWTTSSPPAEANREAPIEAYRTLKAPEKRISPKKHSPRTSKSNSKLKLVQKLLNQSGFQAGREDGNMGEQTRSAIQLFETTKGWTATGKLSPKLINALVQSSQ